MLIGVIADDFTGASDIANTLAKGGLRTAQYAGVPGAPSDLTIEAGVISLKSRSAPVDEAIQGSLSALDWLQRQGCTQIIFKYCSTFDSTHDGNIGPVADALAAELGATGVIVCPAFPTTGRTIYQGHLFVNDMLLNESGMQNHPLTPMTDPDIRRWLRHQTASDVGHLPLTTVLQGPDSVRQALAETTDRFVVADAVTDSDLLTLGAALAGAPLITGGSGIALGLPANFPGHAGHNTKSTEPMTVAGPAAILAGSCSGATRGQIDAHEKNHPCLAIDVPSVMDGTVTVETLIAFFEANEGLKPLAYSSGSPEQVHALQDRYGRENLAQKLDALFADTAIGLIRKGYRRIVAAGGETSGAIAQAVAAELKFPAMMIGREIDPGVPVLSVGKGDPVALALKSGNFGAVDFFAKALDVMEAAK